MIGERIRNERKRAKLSQTELGKLVGYSMNGIAKIERGESDPKFSVISKLADRLGVSIQALVRSPASKGDEVVVDAFRDFLASHGSEFGFERKRTEDGGYSVGITTGGEYFESTQAEREDVSKIAVDLIKITAKPKGRKIRL